MRHSFTGTTFDPSNYKTYYANCHCGAIRYKADVSPPLETEHEVVTCNCSMCLRGGNWNVYIPADKVTWIQGEDKLQSYHYLSMLRNFCPSCGVQLIITPDSPDHPFAGVVALNVRAFRDIDPDKIKILYSDMKDEPPLYDPDAKPTEGVESSSSK